MKKILGIVLLGALVIFAGCGKDDENGSTMQLKINGEVISLKDANFYLDWEEEWDATDDGIDASTHSAAGLYITDADWSQESSNVTYEIYFYVYFPIDDEPSGDYDMSYEMLWDANTRYGYFEAYYNLPGSWTSPYEWVGWDETNADGEMTVKVSGPDEDHVKVKVVGNMERWDYNAGWTLSQDELDVPVTFDFEGDIIDWTSQAVRVSKSEIRSKTKR